MSIRFQSAVLFVSDIAASRAFYEEILGQVVALDHGPNVAFEGGFAIWSADHAWPVIHGRQRGAAPEDVEVCELYFETEDLDAAAARLQEAAVSFVHPLREQPWGQRVLRVRDPDGFVVEIGEPMESVVRRYLSEGLTVEEAATRASMPVESVRRIAQPEA